MQTTTLTDAACMPHHAPSSQHTAETANTAAPRRKGTARHLKLSPRQLEKKRASDRKAQRLKRQRMLEYVGALESQVSHGLALNSHVLHLEKSMQSSAVRSPVWRFLQSLR
ncbi:hypothetical protein ACCO45_009917 [Purpureocillium lilacinum]|uniref:Uncharacterized protein n=1 Tax=Purpureocillium lilacinum TaxID=33203 RepID=A0ACC4DER8_PURLI